MFFTLRYHGSLFTERFFGNQKGPSMRNPTLRNKWRSEKGK